MRRMGLHIRRAANADHESQIHDIIATKEKQAAAKQTFVFLKGNRKFPLLFNGQTFEESDIKR